MFGKKAADLKTLGEALEAAQAALGAEVAHTTALNHAFELWKQEETYWRETEKRLRESEAECGRLRNEREELRAGLDLCEQTLDAARRACRAAEVESAERIAYANEQHELRQAAETEVETLRADRHEYVVKLDALREEIDGVRAERSETLDNCATQLEQGSVALRDAATRLDAAEAKLAEFATALEQALNERDAAHMKLEQQQAEVTRAVQIALDAGNRSVELETKLAEAERLALAAGAELARRTAWSNEQIAKLNADDWHNVADARSAELVKQLGELDLARKERDALKTAVETLLVAGAGTSEFARSQPSDASEIVNLRVSLDSEEKAGAVLRRNMAAILIGLQNESREPAPVNWRRLDPRVRELVDQYAKSPVGVCNVCDQLAPLKPQHESELLDMGAVCAWGCEP